MTTPLLIGGATTSRVHTAVKIAPAYSQPVVHVADASRAVGVAGALVDAGRARRSRPASARSTRRSDGNGRNGTPASGASRSRRRARTGRSSTGPRRRPARRSSACAPSRTTRSPSSWSASTGRRSSRPGSCGAPTRRSSTTRAWAPPRATSTATRWRCSTGSSGSGCSGRPRSSGSGRPTPCPTTTSCCGPTSTRTTEAARIHALRQQMAKPDGRPNVSVADFVGPAGVEDYVGAFAVTAGHGVDELAREFEAAHDDYSSILAKALGDRLAEAFAERLHERVRRELWGYAPDEALANEDLIRERYQGIRPAPGYPATPDHLTKGTLFEPARCGRPRRDQADRVDGDAPRLVRLRDLPLAPRVPLLRDRADGTRPARRLRAAGGHPGRGGGALAGAEPGGRGHRRGAVEARVEVAAEGPA